MSPLLMYLSVMFVATLLISNVIANHRLQFFFWVIDAGALTFPLTYILSDVFQEVYGYKWARRIAWTSLAINAVFALIIILIIRLPQPDFWVDTGGVYFANALGNSWRIVIASLIAFCVGDLADDRVFRRLRERAKSEKTMKSFAFRALVSSLVGHILDTHLFVLIAFAPVIAGGIDWEYLPGMIFIGIVIKWAYEWAVIPITYRVSQWVRKKEDAYASSGNGQ